MKKFVLLLLLLTAAASPAMAECAAIDAFDRQKCNVFEDLLKTTTDVEYIGYDQNKMSFQVATTQLVWLRQYASSACTLFPELTEVIALGMPKGEIWFTTDCDGTVTTKP